MNLAEARKKFPVGSHVLVTDSGECYSGYESWASMYLAPDDYNDWERYGTYLDNGDIGEVIRIAEHSNGFTIIAAIRVPSKKVFLIGTDGIEPYDPPSDGEEMSGDVPFDVACQKALELEKAGYKVDPAQKQRVSADYDLQIANAGALRDREVAEINAREKKQTDDHIADLLGKYQDYATRRTAIEKKYSADIAELEAKKAESEQQ